VFAVGESSKLFTTEMVAELHVTRVKETEISWRCTLSGVTGIENEKSNRDAALLIAAEQIVRLFIELLNDRTDSGRTELVSTQFLGDRLHFCAWKRP
jgi:hypothetical protein